MCDTDGLLVVDARGVIELANSAAAGLFGYPPEDLRGSSFSQLFPTSNPTQPGAWIERFPGNGESPAVEHGGEVKGRRRDGTLRPLRIGISKLPLAERAVFAVLVRDVRAELEHRVADRTDALQEVQALLDAEIAERRRAEAGAAQSREDAIYALKRERELGELKSRFVSLASHEFRTPLSTILSSVELLRRYTTTGQQALRERHIARITKSVVHLTDVLDDFLSLGRLEEGRFRANPAEVELRTLVDEIAEHFRATLKTDQRLELIVALDAPTFRTDARFLRNLLLNLLSNASKYSDAGDTVTLDVRSSPGALHISVVDQGIGIPPDEHPQLFDRFFRARNAETIQGTGLGLHLVSRYLELLEGTIELRSELNVGSTFSVYIPEAPDDDPGAPAGEEVH